MSARTSLRCAGLCLEHRVNRPDFKGTHKRRMVAVSLSSSRAFTAPESIDMRAEWLCDLRSWASKNESVRQLWLFGSRARGNARENSDVDLAIALMPPVGKTDWAFGNYSALGDAWQRELETIMGRHVSLEAILPGTDADMRVRRCGRLLWARG
jgi:predicted nucleotidyltransferase